MEPNGRCSQYSITCSFLGDLQEIMRSTVLLSVTKFRLFMLQCYFISFNAWNAVMLVFPMLQSSSPAIHQLRRTSRMCRTIPRISMRAFSNDMKGSQSDFLLCWGMVKPVRPPVIQHHGICPYLKCIELSVIYGTLTCEHAPCRSSIKHNTYVLKNA